MRHVFAGVLFAVATVTPVNATPATNATCGTLDACAVALRKLATMPGNAASSITPDEVALNRQLLTFGDAIVPVLVEMLADPDLAVANMAAAALRDVERIDAAYLPDVVAGLDRGLGWLGPALGRIGSVDAAREAVDRFLDADSSPHNQEAYAVELSGRRAIPHIVERARCASRCGKRDHYLLGYALGSMDSVGAEALPDLLELVEDDNFAIETRSGGLKMIAALGMHAASAEQRLLALAKRRPDLSEPASDALIGIGSRAAGGLFVHRLRDAPTVIDLRDLAETGRAGMDAGDAVAALLEHTDREMRIAAARTLGFIEYEPADAALVHVLDNLSDPVLSWVAAESLGRMHARSATVALERAAASHWFPPVRQAAVDALEHIADGSGYVSKYHRDNFAFEYFSYQHVGKDLPECDLANPQSAEQAQPGKRYGNAVPERVRKVLTEWETKGEPSVALRVERGWLAGSDWGEWGGQLIYVEDGKQPIEILHENVEDIYRFGDRIIALTGLAHMGMNNGVIFEVQRLRNESWSARPWLGLPGAPQDSRFLTTGDLEIDVVAGGRIRVSMTGNMSTVPCIPK